ncbi:MAG: hypothetical protein JOZ41_05030 [Chloroflexi bacterium]|nr:hypothetical protein [Chloroflexota bacterium]
MSRSEHEPVEESFWHLDEALGELELKERPTGLDLYAVRLKARTGTSSYRPRSEIYPLTHAGTEHEVSGRAYILVPDITLTVDLFPNPPPSGAIGRITSSEWHGMRHHDIAAVRGLYYEQDRALAIWEVDAWGRLDEATHSKLWRLFEQFLLNRYPEATQIFADDAEPGNDTERNRGFLGSLGYTPVAGTARVLAKRIPRGQSGGMP